MTVTKEQLDDIRHALGWSHTPVVEKLGWRNYYVGPSTPHLDDLVEKGFMAKREYRLTRGNYCYSVTRDGARLLGMSEKRIAEVFS